MQEGKEGRKTVSLKMECVWAICLISIRMFVHWKLNQRKNLGHCFVSCSYRLL